jgi:hypothetical protein
MQSPNDLQVKIEQRLRTMRTLWSGLLLSIAVYYVFTLMITERAAENPNSALSLSLLAAGLFLIPASVVIKKKFLTQAVEQQETGIVQQGYVIAWAICEMPALFGVVDFFVTGNSYYFVPMIVALFAQILHYPKQQHIIDASFKSD